MSHKLLKEYIRSLVSKLLTEGKDFLTVRYPDDLNVNPDVYGFKMYSMDVKKVGMDMDNGTMKFLVRFFGVHGTSMAYDNRSPVHQKFPFDDWTVWYDVGNAKIDNVEKNNHHSGVNRRELSSFELNLIKDAIQKMMRDDV